MEANIPAWIQAIGSVMAIAVAIWISNRQAKSSMRQIEEEWMRRSRSERMKNISTIRALIRSAETAASTTIKACGAISGVNESPRKVAASYKTSISIAMAWLENFPLHEAPSVQLANPILNMQLAVANLHLVIDRIVHSDTVDENDKAILALVCDTMTRCKSLLTGFADEYEGDYQELRAADL